MFRRIETMLSIGGWELDLRSGKLVWSEETYRIHDTTPAAYAPEVETAIGFYAPESVPVIREAVDRAIAQGIWYDLELRLITAKGRSIWVRSTGGADHEAGQPVRLCGALQDITDRIEARESLRDSEARLAGVVAMALDAIIVVDSRGAIALFNHAAETMFRVPAAEALGEPAARYLPAWDSGSGSGERRRGTAHRGDGEAFECEAAIARAIHAGVPLYTVIVRDLSDFTRAEAARTLLEEQLRQAQKMEAIGTLAGGIAHDFNNILGAVLGNAEMVLSDLPAEHPARLSLQQILKSTERANNLVRQILAFSRQQKHERRPIGLDTVILDAIPLLRAMLPASIDIRTECEASTPPVLADAAQMQQVLMNLCTNAAQALGSRPGRIEIALCGVQLDARGSEPLADLPAGAYVRVSVTDDGVGMSRETLDRIFDPFFTTRDPGEGSGLGLSVAHGIARAHDGGIVACSRPGLGSTFHLYLPVWEGAGAVAEPEHPPAPGQGERVLLVDDEDALIAVASLLLKRMGYAVTAFTDPVAALAEIRRDAGEIRLVVSDLTMPEINGVELAREVQRMRPGLPVLLTTGYTGELDHSTFGADGIVGVIQKPYGTSALARAVRDALDGIPLI